jgi:hypothetical protein
MVIEAVSALRGLAVTRRLREGYPLAQAFD